MGVRTKQKYSCYDTSRSNFAPHAGSKNSFATFHRGKSSEHKTVFIGQFFRTVREISVKSRNLVELGKFMFSF